MMNRRAILLLALIYIAFGLLCWLSPVKAAESRPTFTCSDVRAAVKTVQESASVTPERATAIVEAMARGQGVGERLITEARRCLSRD